MFDGFKKTHLAGCWQSIEVIDFCYHIIAAEMYFYISAYMLLIIFICIFSTQKNLAKELRSQLGSLIKIVKRGT